MPYIVTAVFSQGELPYGTERKFRVEGDTVPEARYNAVGEMKKNSWTHGTITKYAQIKEIG